MYVDYICVHKWRNKYGFASLKLTSAMTFMVVYDK